MARGAWPHFAATLSLFAAACGARSGLHAYESDSAAPQPTKDAEPEESRADEPVFWTFTTAGSAWALASDEDGNPFFAVHDAPWNPRKTDLYKLDALTKKVIWKTTFTNVPVYSMAYAAGSLYFTGVTYPRTHLDLGNVAIDLPALDSDRASYIAKVDAGDGRAIWAVSPDVGRPQNAQAASKCLGIAADANGAAVLCGYQGAEFGVGKPYLTDRGSFAVLRLASSGEQLWAKAFSGDPVVGHVATFRRPITFDANGDIWFAGMTTLPLVDESSSNVVITPDGDPTPHAYAVRLASSSQTVGPAKSWPLATGKGEREPDVASLASAGPDVFLAGPLGTSRTFYAKRLDAQALATRWQSTSDADVVRATANGGGELFVALTKSETSAGLARFEVNGGLILGTTVATVSCSGCPSRVDASEAQFDRRHGAILFLGVASGHVHFDDGMNVDSPHNGTVVFLARRPAF